MNYLCIDTATSRGAIVCVKGGVVVDSTILSLSYPQNNSWVNIVDTMIHRFSLDTPDFVAVGVGPGSYTGIRSGVSFVEGLAFALQCPIVAVPTPPLFIPTHSGLFLSLIDGRVGGIYTLVGEKSKESITWQGEVALLSVEEVSLLLPKVSSVVTPDVGVLQKRLPNYPSLTWEDARIDPAHFADVALNRYQRGVFVTVPPDFPKILYLKLTEAERNLTR